MKILENYIDVLEASRIMGVHSETIKRMIRNGRLPATKFGNKWIIEKKQLKSFANSYKQGRLKGGSQRY